MSDITLVLDRRGLVVRLENGTLRMDCPGERTRRVPVRMLDRVIVVGNPTVDCRVWRALAERGTSAVLLPSRGSRTAAFLGAGISGNAELRRRQYRACLDKKASLEIAFRLVKEKIAGQKKVLAEMGDASPGPCFDVDTLTPGHVRSAEQLMGVEGAAAAAYFGRWENLLDKKWRFAGRNRRPPKDPVNALLSLTYTLAGSEVKKTVESAGLDPTMGFLHAVKNGRDGLVLDLLEPLRPDADRFVLGLLETKMMIRDFSGGGNNGCFLTKSGRARFYKAWSNELEGGEEGEDGFIRKAAEKIAEIRSLLSGETVSG